MSVISTYIEKALIKRFDFWLGDAEREGDLITKPCKKTRDRRRLEARWFRVKTPIYLEVYLRATVRYLYDQKVTTMDIANINVWPMRRGYGTALVNLIHDYNPFQITYIENVLVEQFRDSLIRNGWKVIPNIYPPCLFKVKDDSICQADIPLSEETEQV